MSLINETKFDEILPSGSVVTLNVFKPEYRNKAEILIIKRFVVEKKEDKEYYEYEGMLLPTGVKDGTNIMFNTEQIEKVLFKGYISKIEKEYLNTSEKLLKNHNMKKKRREYVNL